MEPALIIAAAVVYLLPTCVAAAREHRNAVGVLLVNLFLGWTLLGWVAALVWAVLAQEAGTHETVESRRRPPPSRRANPVPAAVTTLNYTCPSCGAAVAVPLGAVGSVVGCASCGRPFTAVPPPRA